MQCLCMFGRGVDGSELGPFWLCKKKEHGNQYRKVCGMGQIFAAGSQEQQIQFKGYAVKSIDFE